LEERGGAIVIEDSELPAQLLPQVQGLMLDNERRQEMRQTMLTLAKPDAAARIARILLSMTGEPEQERM
jgi:UDP-N-acetylglucosamine:LPS N-acetylglucosamine transferase